MALQAILLATTVAMAFGQRPFFAGHRPIGYPELSTPTATVATDELGNRFGEGDNSTSTTTQRLPIEANGDRDLIDRLSKLPVDNQPFWFINWQALEANRQKPQTYPQRPSHFAGSNNFQPQDVAGDFNQNGDSGFSSETTPPKGSGNRDVDVSSFLANSNGVLGSPSTSSDNAGRPTPNPVNNDLNSAGNDDTLGNRNGNFPDIQNTNPTSTPTPVRPTQNVLFTSSPVPRPVPSYPSQASLNPSHNYGQVVSSFQSVPFSYRPSSSSGQKEAQTSSTPPRIVNGILTDDADYPYPILDPKTRDPSLITRFGPAVNNRPFLKSMFRDYDFEEQRPILSPYAIDSPFYY